MLSSAKYLTKNYPVKLS